MKPSEILEVLLEVAREAELEVRAVGRAGMEPGESPPGSAVCRVKGEVWVMLSEADPVTIQLEVLAEALRSHAQEHLESRYLPPAVRSLLESP